jgi:uncharacterized membrane protein YtjA (UPF0391 family)
MDWSEAAMNCRTQPCNGGISATCRLGTIPALLTLQLKRECQAAIRRTPATEGKEMLSWALTFFILAVIAAVLGFGGIAGAAAGVAQILFFVFIILLIVSAIANALRGRPPV